MNLATELLRLAGDFETLTDTARDDQTFIYDWEPPQWYGARWGVIDDDATGQLLEIVQVLQDAAKELQDK